MPLSTDNQDYGEKDKKNSDNTSTSAGENKQSGNNKLTSDDLKGKKIDADPEKEEDKPANV